jgi:hypothetical protein
VFVRKQINSCRQIKMHSGVLLCSCFFALKSIKFNSVGAGSATVEPTIATVPTYHGNFEIKLLYLISCKCGQARQRERSKTARKKQDSEKEVSREREQRIISKANNKHGQPRKQEGQT